MSATKNVYKPDIITTKRVLRNSAKENTDSARHSCSYISMQISIYYLHLCLCLSTTPEYVWKSEGKALRVLNRGNRYG